MERMLLITSTANSLVCVNGLERPHTPTYPLRRDLRVLKFCRMSIHSSNNDVKFIYDWKETKWYTHFGLVIFAPLKSISLNILIIKNNKLNESLECQQFGERKISSNTPKGDSETYINYIFRIKGNLRMIMGLPQIRPGFRSP